jgi:hypothetical protein
VLPELTVGALNVCSVVRGVVADPLGRLSGLRGPE